MRVVAIIVVLLSIALLPQSLHAEALPGVIAYEAKDFAAALPLLQAEASRGHAASQTKLGLLYAKGLAVKRDPKQGLSWFEKAAAQGDIEAEYCIGVVYDIGDGVPKDLAKAITWYRKSAEHGYAKGQYNLASMLFKGEGIAKDVNAAADWYRKAAEQGYADAQFWLARLLVGKEIADRNMLSAKMWMDRAAAQGSADAKKGKEIIDDGMADLVAAGEIPAVTGGDGSSRADAIFFPEVTSTGQGIDAEHRIMQVFFRDWRSGKQSLHNGPDGRVYDKFELHKGDKTKSIYFDITNWFGQMGDE